MLLLHSNVDHVVIGGDFNAYLSRERFPHTRLLHNFCARNSLDLCVKMNVCTVDYTYENESMQTKSLVDHFLLSYNFRSFVSSYECFHDGDNTSDHSPVFVSLVFKVELLTSRNEHAPKRPSWKKATELHKAAYKERLSELLSQVRVSYDVLDCDLFACENAAHNEMVARYHKDLMNALSTAARETIPSSSKRKRVAGWSEFVASYQQKAILWNRIWSEAGKPETGWLRDIRYKTKAEYKRACKWVMRNQEQLSAERMAQALSVNKDRDLWAEIKKKKGNAYSQPLVVDDAEGNSEICDLFANKF